MAEPTKWGAGRVAVIALRDTISSEIAAGYPLTDIYHRHQERLGVQYVTFTRLVKKLVRQDEPTRPTAKTPRQPVSPTITPPDDDDDAPPIIRRKVTLPK